MALADRRRRIFETKESSPLAAGTSAPFAATAAACLPSAAQARAVKNGHPMPCAGKAGWIDGASPGGDVREREDGKRLGCDPLFLRKYQVGEAPLE